MKTYRWKGVEHPSFLTLAVDAGIWSLHTLAALVPRKNPTDPRN
jgi:hypothetical protein